MKYILFVVLLNICIPGNCNSFRTKQVNEKKYTEKLIKKFSNLRCYNKKEHYSLLFIYHFKFNEKPDKSMFNDSLMSNLDLISNKNKYDRTNVIIYNDSLNVVGYTDGPYVYCNFKPNFYDWLLKYAKEQKVDMLFRISGTNGAIYFGQKDGKILVFKIGESKLDIYSIDEFVNCCWDDLLLVYF